MPEREHSIQYINKYLLIALLTVLVVLSQYTLVRDRRQTDRQHFTTMPNFAMQLQREAKSAVKEAFPQNLKNV